jgi:hypothetical protein
MTWSGPATGAHDSSTAAHSNADAARAGLGAGPRPTDSRVLSDTRPTGRTVT